MAVLRALQDAAIPDAAWQHRSNDERLLLFGDEGCGGGDDRDGESRVGKERAVKAGDFSNQIELPVTGRELFRYCGRWHESVVG